MPLLLGVLSRTANPADAEGAQLTRLTNNTNAIAVLTRHGFFVLGEFRSLRNRKSGLISEHLDELLDLDIAAGTRLAPGLV